MQHPKLTRTTLGLGLGTTALLLTLTNVLLVLARCALYAEQGLLRTAPIPTWLLRLAYSDAFFYPAVVIQLVLVIACSVGAVGACLVRGRVR